MRLTFAHSDAGQRLLQRSKGARPQSARDATFVTPGPEQVTLQLSWGSHSRILIPESFTTLPQCTICAVTNAPNSAGEPPAASAAIFARASRTLGFASAL